MNTSSLPWKVLSAQAGASVLTDGWNLATLEADVEVTRSFSVEVVFDAPFQSAPVVHIGLTGFDVDQRDSARLKVQATSISESGFNAVISTWSNTRVYAVEFQWMAIGA
ncbi:H-type lectin domain-containing protein [Prosthecobacter debontii]|uniref:H-type lectin domain-containing protein n=1 Tax=Prosthecobacter debontii TaxID=48467 RepID=A0A1T4Z571_9BACT|nr:H-type lectin domain-containing protein [Prosthecobacter debontii]SKB09008.1 H-type lectin domain-containing protein [Prosthecobacter debontii]